MHLPPPEAYVSAEDTTFHLHQLVEVEAELPSESMPTATSTPTLHPTAQRLAAAQAKRDAATAELYQQGVSLRQIATAMDLTHPGVRKMLDCRGLLDEDGF